MNDLFPETIDNVYKRSAERIISAYELSQTQGKGKLYVAFSGGKDSVAVYVICKLAAEMMGRDILDVCEFDSGYGFGMSVFTRTEGFGWLPHPNEDMYSTREKALKEALKELINKCRKLVNKEALKIIDNAINMMDDIEQPSLF